MFFLEVSWLAAASWKNGLALLVIFSLAGSTCNRCVLRQELGFPHWILDGYLFIRRTSQSYFSFENRFGFLASMWAEKKVRHGPPLSLHWQLHWCVQHWDKFAPAWLWWSTTWNPFAGWFAWLRKKPLQLGVLVDFSALIKAKPRALHSLLFLCARILHQDSSAVIDHPICGC